jgi:hypothetical protein
MRGDPVGQGSGRSAGELRPKLCPGEPYDRLLRGATFVVVLHKTNMTTKFDAADNPERGPAAGVQDPSLARAHVSGSLSLSLENGPRGRTLRVGEEPAGHTYRWPPVSPSQERDLSAAYSAITGRRVFRGPLRLLILAARLHGPDTIPLLGELYREGGAQDLLARLIAYPSRLNPHPDYVVSPGVPSEVEPQGPADQPTAAPVRVVREQQADALAKDRTPGGLTPIALLLRRPAEEESAPRLPGEPGPVSTPRQDGLRAEPVRVPECRRPSGADSSLSEPQPARRSRPPDCPSPRHEAAWLPRPDGTWTCKTCHP